MQRIMNEISLKKGISVSYYLMNFAFMQEEINNVVVGVESIKQLNDLFPKHNFSKNDLYPKKLLKLYNNNYY